MSSDRWVALLLLALCGLYASQISGIELDAWATDSFLTPRTLPIALVVLCSVGALVLLCVPESTQRLALLSRAQLRRLSALLLALAAFAPLVEWLGLWLACVLFLLTAQWIEGQRRPLPLLATGLVTPAILWVLVEQVLGATVAPGALFAG